MPLIDDRGRLFGRVNLIDFVAAIMLLGLMPLAYGGYLLFRQPDPTINTISPDQAVEGQEVILRITGENLRPFLDLKFGTSQGAAGSGGFYVWGSTQAEVRVPRNLPVGTYDLAVGGQGRTFFTKPAGLTIVPAKLSSSANTDVQVLATFLGLTVDEVRSVAVGSTFASQPGAPAVAEVLAVRSPTPATQRVKVGENAFITVPLPGQVSVQAIIRLRCTTSKDECKVGESVVAQDAVLLLPVPGGRSRRLVVEAVRPPDAKPEFSTRPGSPGVATVRVRFVATPGVLDILRAGDVDVPGAAGAAEADRAVLMTIGADRQSTSMPVMVNRDGAGRQIQLPAVSFTGTVRVPVVYAASGWVYKGLAIKVGAGFQFETISGIVAGWIVGVTVEAER